MHNSTEVQDYSSFSPASAPAKSYDRKKKPFDDEQPRKPDWLLIMVCSLFLITLFIAWLVARPLFLL